MRVGCISLGCSKNLVDLEHMMGVLVGAGHEIVSNPVLADLVIVNTCGFITEAKQESIDAIVEMGLIKGEGNLKYLLAAGCLAQRYPNELLDELPELDGVIGVNEVSSINDILARVNQGERVLEVSKGIWPPQYSPGLLPRLVSTPSGWAYLKVAEGCDNRCTYCSIPAIRGPLRSRPRNELMAEAKKLVDSGVKELILIAQDVTAYGRDFKPRGHLTAIVEELSSLEKLQWIRVMYAYPEKDGRDLISVMKIPKVVPYLDIPIQHGSNRILGAMNRRYDREGMIELFKELRYEVPGIALRTTLLTGFPGETEQDHQENLSLIMELEFDWAGVFAYSKEEGTAAAYMGETVDPTVQAARRNQLMAVQQKITFKRNRQRVSSVVDVIVDKEIGKQYYQGRAYFQAPEVDGIVFLTSAEPVGVGEIIQTTLTDVSGYDMLGEVVFGLT